MKAPVPARNGGARVVVIRVKLADILRRIGLARVLWPRECGSFALAAGVRSPCVDDRARFRSSTGSEQAYLTVAPIVPARIIHNRVEADSLHLCASRERLLRFGAH